MEEHLRRALPDAVPPLEPGPVLRPVQLGRDAACGTRRVGAGLSQRRDHLAEAIAPDPAGQGEDELFSNTADGVCAITADGKITLWNRAAEKILGYSAREVVGRPCCDVFVGRDAAGSRLCYQGCHVQSLVKMGEPVQHFEMATRTKAGKPVWLDVSILVVPGSRNGLQSTVHLFRDVTVFHEMEALVRERLAQSKPVSATVGELSTTLTRREIELLRLMMGGANTKAR